MIEDIAEARLRPGATVGTFADWWGFKLEAYDGIKENIPLVHEAGACAIVHSDSPEGIQRLNQEAAKAAIAGSAVLANYGRALCPPDPMGLLQQH